MKIGQNRAGYMDFGSDLIDFLDFLIFGASNNRFGTIQWIDGDHGIIFHLGIFGIGRIF